MFTHSFAFGMGWLFGVCRFDLWIFGFTVDSWIAYCISSGCLILACKFNLSVVYGVVVMISHTIDTRLYNLFHPRTDSRLKSSM